ncbi:unnamed protein product [Kluyveromyces dobzhanskii CBS 2104]|uniref:Actin-related protein 4 n=1 Tax=Kluyveromyces dobzhanskii CBS 2104 TaxID=1427455 RepID=A0A0A8L5L1_9SACH|nr:unnamed protein product [Kluyveromyces dobzhanskii CBS 2104]
MSNPALQVYGGDEINAIVIDPGSFVTNIGYSGTDCPQSILPSSYGTIDTEDGDQRTIFNEQPLLFPRSGMEIKPIVENSAVVDWDRAQEQWEFALKSDMKFQPNSGTPVLLTEPIWNSESNRKKSLEVLLESMEFEACYLAANPSAVSFAMGRPTCLVVDIGHDVASVSPVIDGMTLSKSSTRNFVAGKYLNHLIAKKLKPREIVPIFQVLKKKPEFVRRTLAFDVSESIVNFTNERQFFQEFKETLLHIAPKSLTSFKDELASQTKRSLESPWGEDLIFDATERHSFAEQLFRPVKDDVPEGWPISADGVVKTWHNDYVPLKRTKPGTNTNTKEKEGTAEPSPVPASTEQETADSPSQEPNENGKRSMESKDDSNNNDKDNNETKNDGGNANDSSIKPETSSNAVQVKSDNEVAGIADLINKTMMEADVDLRATLAHNVVLTGGTSKIPGLSDRIVYELNKSLPALKFRMLSSGHLRERQYQGWLGGSILASLGTFHQLWVGKQEYEEVGADRLLKDRFR